MRVRGTDACCIITVGGGNIDALFFLCDVKELTEWCFATVPLNLAGLEHPLTPS
jgi:hypothetical protein